MNNVIYICIAVEDSLSETVVRSLLRHAGQEFIISSCYGKKGFGYLKRQMRAFNNASRFTPYLVLTDLDDAQCAPLKVREWVPPARSNNLILRVAVRETESWLLAHRSAFAKFLGISQDLIPRDPDQLPNPKEALIELAKRSRKRNLREAIVPPANMIVKFGPDYDGALREFVNRLWDPQEGALNSPSLRKAIAAVDSFQPVYARHV